MSIIEIITRNRPPMKPKKVLLQETIDAFNRVEAILVRLDQRLSHLFEHIEARLNKLEANTQKDHP